MSTLLCEISCGGRKKTGVCSHLFSDMRGSDSLHRLAGWVGDLDEHDLATFTTFIAGARGRLHRAAYRLCGDWHLADDLVQESVLALYRQWSRLDRDQDPYPYIH